MNRLEKLLNITPRVSINEKELEFEFIKSSGPGGQKVNKVSTAVRLKFNVWDSKSLNAETKSRLFRLAGNRINKEGILILESQRHRTQGANKKELVSKFIDLIKQAGIKPKKRLPTKPSKQSVQKRLDMKSRRSQLKQTRRKPQW